MPRSIAEVNALRKLNRAASEHQTPPHDSQGRHGFDPNQPRVPAGHSDGGQWTDEPGAGASSAPRREVTGDHTGKETWSSFVNAYRPDGTVAEQRVFNRDGSLIVSEFNELGGPGDWDERHTVITADGRKVTFETTGNIQRIYDGDGHLISASVWTKDGPEPLSEQLAFLGPAAPIMLGVLSEAELAAATAAVIAAGAALYTWLSSRRGRKGVVITISRDESRPDQFKATWVGRLTDEEFNEACPRYTDVQKFTDKAAADARLHRSDWSPSGFGTEVHTRVAHEVNGTEENGEFRSPDDPKDPNFVAEFSALKAAAANSVAPRPRYGQKGTVRVDVLEKEKNGTVCVYDIKTGERIFAPLRVEEIAKSVYSHYPDTQRFIVTEVRPHT
jgi:hypothetical protein